jgi:hypothetical protein
MDHTHVTETRETTVEKKTVVHEPVETVEVEPKHGETVIIETHTES